MRAMLVIIRRELAAYFASPTAYIFLVIFLVLSAFFPFMVSRFFSVGQARLDLFFKWLPWIYLVLVPAVGMPMWSDERRLGTLELLFTLPVRPSQCIIGKFVASWLFIGLALILTFPMVITVGYLGAPDYGTIGCGYLGSFLMAGAYLAIASMTSAMTRSQVASFIVAAVICLFLVLCGWSPVMIALVDWAPQWLLDGASSLSFITHFESLQRGVVDTRDLVYFLSVIFTGLFATNLLLKNYQAG